MNSRPSATDDATTSQAPGNRPRLRKCGNLIRLAAMIGLASTMFGGFASSIWVADLFVQFRIQLGIGMLAIACLLLISRQWLWVVVCLIGIAINVGPAWPYLVPRANVGVAEFPQGLPADSCRFRLLSLNVLTSNRNADQVIELIELQQPDFVVLMEVDSKWEQALESVKQEFPFTEFHPRPDNFGIAFLSRHPWSQTEVFHSKRLDLPSIDVRFDHGFPSSDSKARKLRLIATHPIPPISTQAWNARNEQLINVAGRFDSETANIMVGDLNLTPWSPHFERVLKIGQLSDSSQGFGLTPTWYLFPTWLGGIKIDHILVGSGVSPIQFRVGPDVGSDHRAVVLDFHVSHVVPGTR